MRPTAPLLKDLVWLAALGDAEVDGLQGGVLVVVQEQQVLGLQVPDDDVLLVALRHDLQHLLDQPGRIALAVGLRAHPLPQQATCDHMVQAQQCRLNGLNERSAILVLQVMINLLDQPGDVTPPVGLGTDPLPQQPACIQPDTLSKLLVDECMTCQVPALLV